MATGRKGPYYQESYPPIPTAFTRYLRIAVAWQFVRFLVIGYRIVRLMVKPQGGTTRG